MLFTETGNTHDEIPSTDPKALSQCQVSIDVLAEFTRLAFDTNGKLAIDQHEHIELVGFVVLQCDGNVTRAGKALLTFFDVLQAAHQGIPFQPLTAEKTADRWRGLHNQADVIFLTIMEAFGDKRKVIVFSNMV